MKRFNNLGLKLASGIHGFSIDKQLISIYTDHLQTVCLHTYMKMNESCAKARVMG